MEVVPKNGSEAENADSAPAEMGLADAPEVVRNYLREAPQAVRDYLERESEGRKVLVARTASTEFFRGPLPPPHVMVEYEKACPGAARDLLDLVVKEPVHRRALERAASNHRLLGLWLAFILALVAFACILYLAAISQTTVAVAIVSALAGIMGVLLLRNAASKSNGSDSDSAAETRSAHTTGSHNSTSIKKHH